jgi:putative restriction endonuclease
LLDLTVDHYRIRLMAFGAVLDHPPGTTYPNRAALATEGVHRNRQAGMVGGAERGTESIVLNGGYRDDRDLGDEIIYTGYGGQDGTGRQVSDQAWEQANQGMRVNEAEGLPVRVIRGWKGEAAFSPVEGFRYDGLYAVIRSWEEASLDGPRICRFQLVKTDEVTVSPKGGVAPTPAPRVASTVMRVVRDTMVAVGVKALYDYTCQVCERQLALPGRVAYAEGAHIRPLGLPHQGPDVPENVLCLCPNDHVRVDKGAIFLTDDLRVVDAETLEIVGRLRRHPSHQVDQAYVAYHRRLFGH